MNDMFRDASAFNQPIGIMGCVVCYRMQSCFLMPLHFNQIIGDWDVSLVTNMREIFNAAVGLSDSNKGEIHR